MPSSPLVTFFYLLMREDLPAGQVWKRVKEAALGDEVEFSAPELEELARRYAHELVGLDASKDWEEPPAPTPEPDPPKPEASPLPLAGEGKYRTAGDAARAVLAENPGRWMKLREMYELAGDTTSFTAFRQAVGRLVRDDEAEGKGATAARQYRATQQVSGASGSAETSPPESSPDGGVGDDPDASADSDSSTVGESPASSSEHGPPSARRSAASVQRGRPLLPASPAVADPPLDLHVRRRRAHRARRPTLSDDVREQVETWVRAQQTFRKRQAADALPHLGPDELHLALVACGEAGLTVLNTGEAGGPFYEVTRNAAAHDKARPSNDATGTLEGRIVQYLEACGGDRLGGIVAHTGASTTQVPATIGKLRREGSVRVEVRSGERIYVAA